MRKNFFLILAIICICLFSFSLLETEKAIGSNEKTEEKVFDNDFIASNEQPQNQPKEKIIEEDQYREIVYSNVKKVVIPKYKVNQNITPVGLDEYGHIKTVENAHEIVWYAIKGVNVHNIILAAHKDYRGEIGAFYDSDRWEKGEELIIEYENGNREVFELKRKYSFRPEETPENVMKVDEGEYRVTVMTCYGKFIKGKGYEKRIYNVFTKKE
ncbi:class F sortase [Bacillus badius]|uniref:class F sortase n=1 Tax=Bacillus badius TaxID=1455 RepID=UPI0007B3AAB4|nr:class F sortase [Bacillus badius]KZR59348.1 hypothetical protein A3781_13180 [Bacillus badius]